MKRRGINSFIAYILLAQVLSGVVLPAGSRADLTVSDEELSALERASQASGSVSASSSVNDGLIRKYLSYAAKEYCHCHFVIGQSDEFCTSYVIGSSLLVRISVNDRRKTVVATAFFRRKAVAGYEGKPFGCRLE